eukprot:gene16969-20187_t
MALLRYAEILRCRLMDSYHRGGVDYALPVLLIQKIIGYVFRYDRNHSILEARRSLRRHRIVQLRLCTLSKEWFSLVFPGTCNGLYSSYVSPYSPLKLLERLEGEYSTHYMLFIPEIILCDIRRIDDPRMIISVIVPYVSRRLSRLTIPMPSAPQHYTMLLELAHLTTLIIMVFNNTPVGTAQPLHDYLLAQGTITHLGLIRHPMDTRQLSSILAAKPAITRLDITQVDINRHQYQHIKRLSIVDSPLLHTDPPYQLSFPACQYLWLSNKFLTSFNLATLSAGHLELHTIRIGPIIDVYPHQICKIFYQILQSLPSVQTIILDVPALSDIAQRIINDRHHVPENILIFDYLQGAELKVQAEARLKEYQKQNERSIMINKAKKEEEDTKIAAQIAEEQRLIQEKRNFYRQQDQQEQNKKLQESLKTMNDLADGKISAKDVKEIDKRIKIKNEQVQQMAQFKEKIKKEFGIDTPQSKINLYEDLEMKVI